jgi:hypothetical protein
LPFELRNLQRYTVGAKVNVRVLGVDGNKVGLV